MATHGKLAFDFQRPFGPLQDDDTCTVGLKSVRFDGKADGYWYGMQMTQLIPHGVMKDYVLSLKITGLVPDHGFNAVAVVMQSFQTESISDNDMFVLDESGDKKEHDLWITSQETCLWENTLLTLIISPNHDKVDAYVEQILDDAGHEKEEVDSDSKKRKLTNVKEDCAVPYVHDSDKHLWTDLGDGLRTRSFKAKFMDSAPNIGIRMSGYLGNKVEIRAASQRVIEASKLDKAFLVVYS